MIFKYLIVIIVALKLVNATNEWPHNVWLDPSEKYHLKWKTDDESKVITFESIVQTKGWIGFGLSPNGGMKGSDIVIGWVNDDGKPYFHDRHATDETLPKIDPSQDWSLISSSQNATHTIMQFSRPYVTCDDVDDMKITDDTIKIIYAFGDNDPQSVNEIAMHKHHNRGSKTVLLLSHSRHDVTFEDDIQILDLRVNNVTIPAKHTTYWCKMFKINLPQKRHVIKYDAVIPSGNEPFTHHAILFTCYHPDPQKLEIYLTSEGAECTEINQMPMDFLHCTTPYFVWAVGGESFILPQEAGFPIGEDDDTKYFLLQTHYDNPNLVPDIKDSSGLRIYHTGKFRQYDATTLTVGSVTDFRVFIPPKQPEFPVNGHCDSSCFEKIMPKDGVKLFAAFPHAHYLGKSIKTRHFRGDTELPWIINNDHYDFNFGQFQAFKNLITYKSGDIITTECIYDSSKKDRATLGGLSTNDEMCLTFISYYPRMKGAKPCLSGLTPAAVMSMAEIEDITGYIPNNDPTIVLPLKYANKSLSRYLMEKDDWNYKLINETKHLLKYSKQRPTCYWLKAPGDIELDSLIGYPDLKSIYTPPKIECRRNGAMFEELKNSGISHSYSFSLLINFFSIVMIMFI